MTGYEPEPARDLAGMLADALEHRIARVVPPRYLSAETDNTQAGAWIDDPHDFCYLSGPVGAGKTHIAYAMLMRWMRKTAPRHLTAQAFSTGELLHRLRPGNARVIPGGAGSGESWSDKVVDHFGQACEADLLLLDDLGSDKLTDWGLEQISTILSHRYNALLPTLITSNVTPAEVAATIGQRLASRFAHDGTVIAVVGDDRRQKAR